MADESLTPGLEEFKNQLRKQPIVASWADAFAKFEGLEHVNEEATVEHFLAVLTDPAQQDKITAFYNEMAKSLEGASLDENATKIMAAAATLMSDTATEEQKKEAEAILQNALMAFNEQYVSNLDPGLEDDGKIKRSSGVDGTKGKGQTLKSKSFKIGETELKGKEQRIKLTGSPMSQGFTVYDNKGSDLENVLAVIEHSYKKDGEITRSPLAYVVDGVAIGDKVQTELRISKASFDAFAIGNPEFEEIKKTLDAENEARKASGLSVDEGYYHFPITKIGLKDNLNIGDMQIQVGGKTIGAFFTSQGYQLNIATETGMKRGVYRVDEGEMIDVGITSSMIEKGLAQEAELAKGVAVSDPQVTISKNGATREAIYVPLVQQMRENAKPNEIVKREMGNITLTSHPFTRLMKNEYGAMVKTVDYMTILQEGTGENQRTYVYMQTTNSALDRKNNLTAESSPAFREVESARFERDGAASGQLQLSLTFRNEEYVPGSARKKQHKVMTVNVPLLDSCEGLDGSTKKRETTQARQNLTSIYDLFKGPFSGAGGENAPVGQIKTTTRGDSTNVAIYDRPAQQQYATADLVSFGNVAVLERSQVVREQETQHVVDDHVPDGSGHDGDGGGTGGGGGGGHDEEKKPEEKKKGKEKEPLAPPGDTPFMESLKKGDNWLAVTALIAIFSAVLPFLVPVVIAMSVATSLVYGKVWEWPDRAAARTKARAQAKANEMDLAQSLNHEKIDELNNELATLQNEEAALKNENANFERQQKMISDLQKTNGMHDVKKDMDALFVVAPDGTLKLRTDNRDLFDENGHIREDLFHHEGDKLVLDEDGNPQLEGNPGGITTGSGNQVLYDLYNIREYETTMKGFQDKETRLNTELTEAQRLYDEDVAWNNANPTATARDVSARQSAIDKINAQRTKLQTDRDTFNSPKRREELARSTQNIAETGRFYVEMSTNLSGLTPEQQEDYVGRYLGIVNSQYELNKDRLLNCSQIMKMVKEQLAYMQGTAVGEKKHAKTQEEIRKSRAERGQQTFEVKTYADMQENAIAIQEEVKNKNKTIFTDKVQTTRDKIIRDEIFENIKGGAIDKQLITGEVVIEGRENIKLDGIEKIFFEELGYNPDGNEGFIGGAGTAKTKQEVVDAFTKRLDACVSEIMAEAYKIDPDAKFYYDNDIRQAIINAFSESLDVELATREIIGDFDHMNENGFANVGEMTAIIGKINAAPSIPEPLKKELLSTLNTCGNLSKHAQTAVAEITAAQGTADKTQSAAHLDNAINSLNTLEGLAEAEDARVTDENLKYKIQERAAKVIEGAKNIKVDLTREKSTGTTYTPAPAADRDEGMGMGGK